MSYGLDNAIKVENGKTFFPKERMQDINQENDWKSSNLTEEEYKNLTDEEFAFTIEVEVTDTSRWSTYYRAVFKLKDKFYETSYSRGSTEIQDEPPYEYDGLVSIAYYNN